MPSQIFAIGLNYRRHAEETNPKIPEFPVLFAKGLNSLQNPGDPIFIPTHLASQEVDHECELAVVIGRSCKNMSRNNALDYVLGYTCANDVSARDWQKKGEVVSGAAPSRLTLFVRSALAWLLPMKYPIRSPADSHHRKREHGPGREHQ